MILLFNHDLHLKAPLRINLTDPRWFFRPASSPEFDITQAFIKTRAVCPGCNVRFDHMVEVTEEPKSGDFPPTTKFADQALEQDKPR